MGACMYEMEMLKNNTGTGTKTFDAFSGKIIYTTVFLVLIFFFLETLSVSLFFNL
jgi:hypothetical protein